jgi:hypothetical protein
MHALSPCPSPASGRGVRVGIRVPRDAPLERLPDVTGNAPCKGSTGRDKGTLEATQRANSLAINGNINKLTEGSPRYLSTVSGHGITNPV